MSMRTIVEFNHDFGHAIERDPEGFVRAIRTMINAGSQARNVEDDLRQFGVRAVPTAHHSCKRKVVLATETGRVYSETEF